MLHLFLLALAIVPASEDKTARADPAAVKAALVELEKAFKSGETGDRVRAIEAAAAIEDGEVVASIAKGLRDREPDVRRGAIAALRHNAHPKALDELHVLVAQDRALRKEPATFAAVLRAIGQHGDARSIAILEDDPWSVPDHAVIQARILGLGRIRTPAAVEALFDLMKVAGPQKIQPFMEDFRTSLRVLTGVDQGASRELWFTWWNDNKGKLKIAPEVGELPKPMQARWSAYWEEGARGTPDEKRERRDRRDGKPPREG